MISIHFLVTRMLEPLADGIALAPEEAISVRDAVRVHTYNGAYTTFEEESKGSLEAGKLADITVLSEDILAISPERLRDVRTDITILDGTVVYERPGL
jgi:predicted amidohydrolase YtcJ